MALSDPTVAELNAVLDEQPLATMVQGAVRTEPTDLKEPPTTPHPEVEIDLPTPFPTPFRLGTVSGRFVGSMGGFRVELRVDVDGTKPTGRVSGDFFSVS